MTRTSSTRTRATALAVALVALAVAAAVGTVVGAYYYLRLIKIMFIDPPAAPFERRREPVEAAVHPLPEDRLGLVEVPRHASVLRPAAGEHEDHLGRLGQRLVGEDLARVPLLEQGRRLARVQKIATHIFYRAA